MQRRTFLTGTLLASGTAMLSGTTVAAQRTENRHAEPVAADPPDAPNEPTTHWHDVTDWGVEGRGFDDTGSYFDRFPARAEAIVRPEVWVRSRHTTGMAVRFKTDAARIDVDYDVLNRGLGMAHMPATGVSGLDLYTKQDGTWRWVSVYIPKDRPLRGPIVDRLAPTENGEPREFLLYLPLYNGVASLKLGVPDGASFEGLPPRDVKPIVFYGTSITHGACASRPGMAFVNILGRRLHRPMLNYGFSGQGKMEPEVATLLAELNPAVFVLDCMANTPRDRVEPGSYEVVKLWRDAHPETPIVMIESRSWSSADLVANRQATHTAKRAAMRKTHQRLREEGMTRLHYVRGEDLLGDDHEATTDGSHPSDLGMMRYADALEPVVRRALRNAPTN